VELELVCPNCKEASFITANLEDLPVTLYPAEREFTYRLPVSGKEVKFGYLDGHKEKQLPV